MSEVVRQSPASTALHAPFLGATPARAERRATALLQRRREDLWLAGSGLVAAMLVLPLAPGAWHGPEMAASLAVGATALFAGQRWAIAIIVLCELLLIPTSWPRAFLGDDTLITRLPALISLLASVPGVLALRRAAAALALLMTPKRTSQTVRRFHVGLIAIGLIAALLPIL